MTKSETLAQRLTSNPDLINECILLQKHEYKYPVSKMSFHAKYFSQTQKALLDTEASLFNFTIRNDGIGTIWASKDFSEAVIKIGDNLYSDIDVSKNDNFIAWKEFELNHKQHMDLVFIDVCSRKNTILV